MLIKDISIMLNICLTNGWNAIAKRGGNASLFLCTGVLRGVHYVRQK